MSNFGTQRKTLQRCAAAGFGRAYGIHGTAARLTAAALSPAAAEWCSSWTRPAKRPFFRDSPGARTDVSALLRSGVQAGPDRQRDRSSEIHRGRGRSRSRESVLEGRRHPADAPAEWCPSSSFRKHMNPASVGTGALAAEKSFAFRSEERRVGKEC